MRILQLCKKFPYPIKDGEVIAITNLARALNTLGVEVHLLCINTPKHFFDKKALPDSFDFYKSIHSVSVDTNLKAHQAFFNLFSKKSYHIDRFVSSDFSRKLIELLKTLQPDMVQMETLFLAPYLADIRTHSNAQVLMRAHNVEHEIWSRITENTDNFIKKKYLAYLTKKLKNFEVQHLNQYDLLLPITNRDLTTFQQLGFKGEAEVIPIGIDIKNYQPKGIDSKKPLSISFIGSLDWLPNLEGLNWFLKNCWPKILERYPNLTLHLAGRNTPDSLHALTDQNITIHGEVPDAQDFINAHPIMIVPLLSGSGMRVKILEGMALGRVVITTTIGLEGIAATDRVNVLVADTVEEWMGRFDFCMEERMRLGEMGEAARQLISEEYDNLKIGRKWVEGAKKMAIKARRC